MNLYTSVLPSIPFPQRSESGQDGSDPDPRGLILVQKGLILAQVGLIQGLGMPELDPGSLALPWVVQARPWEAQARPLEAQAKPLVAQAIPGETKTRAHKSQVRPWEA